MAVRANIKEMIPALPDEKIGEKLMDYCWLRQPPVSWQLLPLPPLIIIAYEIFHFIILRISINDVCRKKYTSKKMLRGQFLRFRWFFLHLKDQIDRLNVHLSVTWSCHASSLDFFPHTYTNNCNKLKQYFRYAGSYQRSPATSVWHQKSTHQLAILSTVSFVFEQATKINNAQWFWILHNCYFALQVTNDL